MAEEKRNGPFKVMKPRTWLPDPKRTERILRSMPVEPDQKGEKRG